MKKRDQLKEPQWMTVKRIYDQKRPDSSQRLVSRLEGQLKELWEHTGNLIMYTIQNII